MALIHAAGMEWEQTQSHPTLNKILMFQWTHVLVKDTVGKKRSRSTQSIGPKKYRKRILEYAVLFFEPPLCRRTRPFNVLAFVCHNCTIAMKVRLLCLHFTCYYNVFSC